jgi:hypothetical protein
MLHTENEKKKKWGTQAQGQENDFINRIMPIAVAARSEARTVFARSNTAIVSSNPTGGMDVCLCSVRVYSVST